MAGQVADPETIRYVGASYVNLISLNSYYRRDMLKNQVRLLQTARV